MLDQFTAGTKIQIVDRATGNHEMSVPWIPHFHKTVVVLTQHFSVRQL
jgi:hypothetical protein